ncbi:MAG: A24 family peptidase [Ectothiorhodospiraceae bacterium]|jgi:leader peptidase (prepilin peptidase)/N-methyltransferase|nr:A24 family peptidase [Ectothiorhodospiraceae bacterium]
MPDSFASLDPWFFYLATGLLALLIGSFLNVVIHRLPIMMERHWRTDCRELLGVAAPADETADTPYNLVVPRSACPGCGHRISALENIPILSYLVLRGRCAGCGTRIPLQYPLVELTTAVLSLLVLWRFGPGWQMAAACLLTWALIALAVIDLRTQLLPDGITLPFLWLGLLLNLGGLFTDLQSAVLGAAAGYLALWLVYQGFRLLTGKEGMGFGDFKLLGMLGAWMGWQALPVIILLSSFVGALVGVSLILFRRHDRNIPIPFGPYLAAAGWIALLWGDSLVAWYLDFLAVP